MSATYPIPKLPANRIRKKIKLLKERIVNSALMTGQYFEFQQRQTALLCLPCDYIAGKMMLVRALEGHLNLIISKPAAFTQTGNTSTFKAAEKAGFKLTKDDLISEPVAACYHYPFSDKCKMFENSKYIENL